MLKVSYNMSFKRLKKVAYQGNSQRSIVTRLLYAKAMLKLLEEGKRIINIDETWLTQMYYRSRSWRERGQANTISAKSISHRISMIAAVDTDGRLYLSITQQNTDSKVMLASMFRLALLLSQDDKERRKTTYWCIDNAFFNNPRKCGGTCCSSVANYILRPVRLCCSDLRAVFQLFQARPP